MQINAYCEDRGWLFNDLLRQFGELPGVVATHEPTPDADAWICIRTRELGASPDTKRTLVQVHDLYPRHRQRDDLQRCGAICYTHPEQVDIMRAEIGSEATGKLHMLRPIGAKLMFFDVERKPRKRFTVGWVGRVTGAKNPPLLEEVLNLLPDDMDVMLVGDMLERLNLTREVEKYPKAEHPHETWPHLYAQMDCLLITSKTEAGPLPLFEAAAARVPAISTGAGWSAQLGAYEAQLPSEFVAHVERLARVRRRKAVRLPPSVVPTHESWLEENFEMARRLA